MEPLYIVFGWSMLRHEESSEYWNLKEMAPLNYDWQFQL